MFYLFLIWEVAAVFLAALIVIKEFQENQEDKN